jgi:hypothetical protein
MSDASGRMLSRFGVIEFIVGFSALLFGIISLLPSKVLGVEFMVQISILSYIITGVILIAVAASRLLGTSTYEASNATKWLIIATCVVAIAPMVLVLYLKMTSATESSWFHYLFGISLLSYAVGGLVIGLLSKLTVKLKAVTLGFGTIILALSIIVIMFNLIPISQTSGTTKISDSNSTITVPSGVLTTAITTYLFVTISLILIGTTLILTATLNMLKAKQKQSPQPV